MQKYFIILVFCFIFNTTNAGYFRWSATASSSDWNTASNWVSNAVPDISLGSDDTVEISGFTTNTPKYPSSSGYSNRLKGLYINNATLDLNGGILIINSYCIIDSALIINSSSVVATFQPYDGFVTLINESTFGNGVRLDINQVSITNQFNVYGQLRLNLFYSNHQLKMSNNCYGTIDTFSHYSFHTQTNDTFNGRFNFTGSFYLTSPENTNYHFVVNGVGAGNVFDCKFFINNGFSEGDVKVLGNNLYKKGILILSQFPNASIQPQSNLIELQGTLETNQTIDIDSMFANLTLTKFKQKGNTPIMLNPPIYPIRNYSVRLGGSTSSSDTCVFEGKVHLVASRVRIDNCKFYDTTYIEKVGGFIDESSGTNPGNNKFFKPVSIVNSSSSSTASLIFNSTNLSLSDYYYDSLTLIANNAAKIILADVRNAYFYGSIGIQASDSSKVLLSGSGGIAYFTGNKNRYITSNHTILIDELTLDLANSNAYVMVNNNVRVKSVGASGALKIIKGKLRIPASNHLLMPTNTICSSPGSVNDFVDGEIWYEIAGTGQRNVFIPIGKDNIWGGLFFRAQNLVATPYIYKFNVAKASAEALGFSKPMGIDTVSKVRYTSIKRYLASTMTEDNSNILSNMVRMYFNTTQDYVQTPSQIQLLKNAPWAPTTWINETRNVNSNAFGIYVESDTFNAFSVFTLAGNNSFNPLPVNLIKLSGESIEKGVQLNWNINFDTKKFIIQAYKNGVFEDLLHIVNESNSVFEYERKIETNTGASKIFRIKAIDENGNEIFSNLLKINISQSVIILYPNPSTADKVVAIEGLLPKEEFTLYYYNIIGKLVFNENVETDAQGQIILNNSQFNNETLIIITIENKQQIIKQIIWNRIK